MKQRTVYTCPLEMVHDIIRGKWKPIILWQLGKKEQSLSELFHSIEGITQKMLLEHLKELQEFDIVSKEEFEGYPLRVVYSLTDKGKQVLEIIGMMQKVGIELMLEDGKEALLKEKGLIE